MPDPVPVDQHRRRARSDVDRQPLTSRFDDWLELGGQGGKQLIHRFGRPVQGGGATFQPAKIEQVVDDAQQAVGIVPRGLQQFPLRGRDLAEIRFEQKVDRHAQARQRRFEFMADRADEVVLGIVQESELRDVLQEDGRPAKTGERIAHRENARQKVVVFATDPKGDHPVIARGQIVIARLQNVRERLPERRGESVGKLRLPRQHLRCRIPQFDVASSGDHEDRIRRRGERRLHRPLGAQDLRGGGIPEGPQLGGHGIEGLGELTQLIMRQHRRVAVEGSVAQRHGRSGQDSDRPEQRTAKPVREIERKEHRGRHRAQQELHRCPGSPAGTGQFCLHDVVIELRQVFQGFQRGEAGRRGRAVHRLAGLRAHLEKDRIRLRLGQEGIVDGFNPSCTRRAGRRHRLFVKIPRKEGALGIELPGSGRIAGLRLVKRPVHRRGRILHHLRRQHRPVIGHHGEFQRTAQLLAGTDRIPAHGDQQEQQREQAEIKTRAKHVGRAAWSAWGALARISHSCARRCDRFGAIIHVLGRFGH